jgi:hypothetical protein
VPLIGGSMRTLSSTVGALIGSVKTSAIGLRVETFAADEAGVVWRTRAPT